MYQLDEPGATVGVLKNPRLVGGAPVYDIDVLEEDETDTIRADFLVYRSPGMPASPTSVAGAHRRRRRRHRRRVSHMVH